LRGGNQGGGRVEIPLSSVFSKLSPTRALLAHLLTCLLAYLLTLKVILRQSVSLEAGDCIIKAMMLH